LTILAAIEDPPVIAKMLTHHCPNCGGALTIIAAILDPAVIATILRHLGLPIRAPPRAPARRPDLFHAA
jgi:hypothetical protein